MANNSPNKKELIGRINTSLHQKNQNQPTIDQSAFIQWYEDRILSFELFENAVHLSKHAFETENVEEFSSLYKLLYLESLLNKISEHNFTYKQMKDMSNDEILDVILTFKSDSSQDEIDKRIE